MNKKVYMPEKCCDNCKWYHWYFDFCEKYQCEMNARSCQDCFESEDEDQNAKRRK